MANGRGHDSRRSRSPLIVADACVALKWFLSDETFAHEAAEIIRTGTAVIAPDLLIPEVVNAAWKSARLGRMTSAQVTRIANRLPSFLTFLAPTADLAVDAARIALHLGHPVYDCFYLALAEREDIPLVTADDRLLARLSGTVWAARAVHISCHGMSSVTSH